MIEIFVRKYFIVFVFSCFVISCRPRVEVVVFKDKFTLKEELSLKENFSVKEAKSFLEGNLSLGRKKHIFLIMSDTLRDDHVTKELMPNLYAFKQDSLRTKTSIASANATYHSNFSLFYSQPAFKKESMTEWKKGSVFVNILKKTGYEVNLFADPLSWPCFDKKNFVHGNIENMKQAYGNPVSALVDYCVPHENWNKNMTHAIRDNRVTDGFVSQLPKILAKNKVSYNQILLNSPHENYSWIPKTVKNPLQPSRQGLGIAEPEKSEYETYRNSYKNSAQGVDYQLGRIFSLLKKHKLYDSSIIIFYSDHGERLFENNLIGEDRYKNGHGGVGYKQVAEIPLFYKFPGRKKTMELPLVSSLMDVFPSVLDYLDFSHKVESKKFLLGESIFSKNHPNCAINVKPQGTDNPYIFLFQNKSYKVWLEFIRSSLWETKIKIKRLTDLNDRDISQSLVQTKDYSAFFAEEFKPCLDIILKNRRIGKQ